MLDYSAAKGLIETILTRERGSSICFVNHAELVRLKDAIDKEVNAMQEEIMALRTRLNKAEYENSTLKKFYEEHQQRKGDAVKINKIEAITMFNEGYSVSDIARHFRCSINAVGKMLRKAGITPEKRYSSMREDKSEEI